MTFAADLTTLQETNDMLAEINGRQRLSLRDMEEALQAMRAAAVEVVNAALSPMTLLPRDMIIAVGNLHEADGKARSALARFEEIRGKP